MKEFIKELNTKDEIKYEKDCIKEDKIYEEAKIMEFIYEEDIKKGEEELLFATGTVGMYFKDICNYHVLSIQEEKDLYPYLKIRNEANNKLNDYNNEIINLSDEEIEKYEKDLKDNEWVKEKFINHNLRLVCSIAKKYSKYVNNMEFLDLIQEGNLGLMKAVDRFDPTKNVKFSTYAVWWIRQAITRSIGDNDRSIRLPIHIIGEINEYLSFKNKIFIERGKDPSDEEIVNDLYIKKWIEKYIEIENHKPSEKEINNQKIIFLKKLDVYKQNLSTPISLSTPIIKDEDGDSVISDFVEDHSVIKPDEYTINSFMKKDLNNVIDKILDEKQSYILKMRFGLIDGVEHTLEEIGNILNLTRERIRQIEVKCISKIKRSECGRALIDYIKK